MDDFNKLCSTVASVVSSALSHELRATLRLAGPVVAAQLAHISMSFVDTVMVGRLGPEALAGVALGHTVFFFFAIMGMGMVRAVGPMVSQAVGAEAPVAAGRSVRQGLWLAGGLGAVILVILSTIEPVLRWTGQEPTAIDGATAYLNAIRWGILPFLGFAALRSFVEGLSRPLPVTIIAFIGVGVNIAANEVLMFGYWGLPALGLAGTGWASTIVFSALFGLLALFVHCTAPFSDYEVFTRLREPDPATLRELVWVGAPMGASRGVESSLFMVTTVMMGTLGTTALAAHQVALQCAAFAFMVPLGIGMAGTVRVGQAAGAQDEAGARRAGGMAMGLAQHRGDRAGGAAAGGGGGLSAVRRPAGGGPRGPPGPQGHAGADGHCGRDVLGHRAGDGLPVGGARRGRPRGPLVGAGNGARRGVRPPARALPPPGGAGR
jgi:MATE family multidrug resistance protein